jgi:uncharacterized protein YdeI (YjbR/CyaY-like superfamily)
VASIENVLSGLPVAHFKNQKAWKAWISKHYSVSDGVWLRLSKKSATLKSLSYQEALEVALCYGWIDGQKKTYDEQSWLQRFSPRGRRSIWSKINRSKAERLVQEGRMHQAGLAAIEKAKQNGQWEKAYDSQKTATPAKDFEEVLHDRPKAKAFFESLNSQNRYAILFRIHNAKKAETRKKRIEKFILMLEKHEKLYP